MAGCTRSNRMAKAYSNRTLDQVRKTAREELGCDINITASSSGFETNIHVDDTSPESNGIKLDWVG